MTAPSEDVRVLAALTNLLLCQLAELRRLQADSQSAATPVTSLLDGIARRAEQAAQTSFCHHAAWHGHYHCWRRPLLFAGNPVFHRAE